MVVVPYGERLEHARTAAWSAPSSLRLRFLAAPLPARLGQRFYLVFQFLTGLNLAALTGFHNSNTGSAPPSSGAMTLTSSVSILTTGPFIFPLLGGVSRKAR